MKNLVLLIVVIFASCKSQNNATIITKHQLTDTLTTEEGNIVNDFLDIELASERYKYYINQEIILVKEAGSSIGNLITYEYAYNDWHSNNKATFDDNERLGWILDTIQIKELKSKCFNEKVYHWKISDIKNFKVNIMKNDTLRNIVNTGKYLNFPAKLILQISKPSIINSETAFISFRIGALGLNTINNYTALMKKTNGKWKIIATYWGGMVD